MASDRFQLPHALQQSKHQQQSTTGTALGVMATTTSDGGDGSSSSGRGHGAIADASAATRARLRRLLVPADDADDEPNELHVGERWFVVPRSWRDAFLAATAPERQTTPTTPVSLALPPICNAPLVDTTRSSSRRRVVLLKPEVVVDEDFVFVPEGAWEELAEHVAFDWEIPREVIAVDGGFAIEAHPLALQLFAWSVPPAATATASDVDDALAPVTDERGRAVLVALSRGLRVADVATALWDAAPRAFHAMFPHLRQSDLVAADRDQQRPQGTTTSTNSRSELRLCLRLVRDEDDAGGDDRSRRTSGGGGVVGAWQPLGALADKALKARRGGPRGPLTTASVLIGDVVPKALRLAHARGPAGGIHGHVVVERRLAVSELSDARDFPTAFAARRWRYALDKDDPVDALDTVQHWCEALVCKGTKRRVLVHYRGWAPRWDEWLERESPRLAPAYTRVPPWRAHLRERDRVQVGGVAPGTPPRTLWRDAVVVEVERGGADGRTPERVRVAVEPDGDELWVDVNSELLSPAGTHKLPTKRKAQQPLAQVVDLTGPGGSEGHATRTTPSKKQRVMRALRRRRQREIVLESEAEDDDDDEEQDENETPRAAALNNGASPVVPKGKAVNAEDDEDRDDDSDADDADDEDDGENTHIAIASVAKTSGIPASPTMTSPQGDAWRARLRPGSIVEVRDPHALTTWFDCRVEAVDPATSAVQVHYRGRPAALDEWLERMSPRLAPAGAHLGDWRAFPLGASVHVGFSGPEDDASEELAVEWKTARVVGGDRHGRTGRCLRVRLCSVGETFWRDADDDLLAPGGRAIFPTTATMPMTLPPVAHVAPAAGGAAVLSDEENDERPAPVAPASRGHGRNHRRRATTTGTSAVASGAPQQPVPTPTTPTATAAQPDLGPRLLAPEERASLVAEIASRLCAALPAMLDDAIDSMRERPPPHVADAQDSGGRL